MKRFVACLLCTVVLLLLSGPAAHASKSCPQGSTYEPKTKVCIDNETGDVVKRFRF